MHSADEAPPLGEPIAAVYSRMASFYEGVCAPLAASGSNVLVVSHQYALEPLALYLAGEPPESYRNVNLPNGKALTPEDLAECMRAQHGGGWRQRMQHLGDACVLASAYVAPATLCLGAAAVVARGGEPLPGPLGDPAACRLALVAALALSTFYALLEVDLPVAAARCPRPAALIVLLQVAARAAVGTWMLLRARAIADDSAEWADGTAGGVIKSEDTMTTTRAEAQLAFASLQALFWLLPPAMTCPSLSLMWGGGLYLAVTGAMALSALLPLLLLALVAVFDAVPGGGVPPASLWFFAAVFVGGGVAPALAAHGYRSSSPVECKRHAKTWRWLTAPALWVMAFAASQLFTPPGLGEALFPSSLELLLGGSGDGGSFFQAPLPAARRWGIVQQSVSAQAALLIAGNFLVTRFAALSACWLLGKYEVFASEQKERRRKEEEEEEEGEAKGGGSSAADAAASSAAAERRRGRGLGLSARLSASAMDLLEPKGSRRQGDIDTLPERDEGNEEGEIKLGGGGRGATDADDDAKAPRPTTATAPAAAASEPAAGRSGGSKQNSGHRHGHGHGHDKKRIHIRGYTSADVLAQMNQLDA